MAMDRDSFKKLEEQLRQVGNELSQFPTQVDELLSLLDKLGSLLTRAEQKPPQLIKNAYSQCMEALVAEPLLRHIDADVQVAVASCIIEIMRITAPEAPYSDIQLEEVFQLIVSSFENLFDMSSLSYDKRASILEVADKTRSVVLMLDLDCDGLISEMFQHFLSSIRDFHPVKIFISMESVMTLILEQSDDVSLEHLIPILATLKRNNEEISTSARKLGESVLANCACNLQPCLKKAVELLGLPLDDYSEIVARICNEFDGEVEHKSDNVSVQKEKQEAAGLVSKLSGHDDDIVAINKNDRAANDFRDLNFAQISEKSDAVELMSKPFGRDDEIVAIDKNDGAAGETTMPVLKRKLVLTTKDCQTQIDNTAPNDNASVSGKKSRRQSQTTISKRATKFNSDDDKSSKLEETIGILAGIVDEIAIPAPNRRHLTTADIQTEIGNTAFVDNAPVSGTKSQSQSKTTTSKRTAKSKNDDVFSNLEETIGILAGTLRDMVDNKKLPIPVDELWGFLHEMKLDEDLAGDAFVFLLERPVQLKGLISTPTGIRKSILMKMMMRNAK